MGTTISANDVFPLVSVLLATMPVVPMKTRMKVPRNSAEYFCQRVIAGCSLLVGRREGWQRGRTALRGPVQVCQPHLHERAYGVLDPRLPGQLQRPHVALAHLRRVDALLQAVVSSNQELANLLSSVFLHVSASLRSMVQALAVLQVLLSMSLVGLVLMHSGRDTGFGGMGYTPASQGGTHIVERNLTRLTIVVALLFGANTVALFNQL